MNLKIKSLMLGMVLVAGLSMVAHADEKMVWYAPWDGATWGTNAVVDLNSVTFAQDSHAKTNGALARTFNSDPFGGDQIGYTNQQGTGFSFVQNASIAQWIKWEIDTTQKDWYIRQPGLYYSDGIKFKLASNGAVAASFSQFNDLAAGTPVDGTQNSIETFYSLDGKAVAGGADPGKPEQWIRAEDLNTVTSAVIPNTGDLHYGQQYELWTLLQVEPSNSAGSYSDLGVVTFQLQNQQSWVADSGLMNFH